MTLRRVLPVVIMAALVVLAGAVLLRQPAQSSAPGRITSVAAQEVCLDTGGHDVCLDPEHVEHLQVRGMSVGQCLDVTWAGDLVVAESLVRVLARPC